MTHLIIILLVIFCISFPAILIIYIQKLMQKIAYKNRPLKYKKENYIQFCERNYTRYY